MRATAVYWIVLGSMQMLCSFGAKGCITWSREPIQNYRDYKATDFDLAYAQWIPRHQSRRLSCRQVFDEQWLISIMHGEAETLNYANIFQEFIDELLV